MLRDIDSKWGRQIQRSPKWIGGVQQIFSCAKYNFMELYITEGCDWLLLLELIVPWAGILGNRGHPIDTMLNFFVFLYSTKEIRDGMPNLIPPKATLE